jgi:hypothetical protein
MFYFEFKYSSRRDGDSTIKINDVEQFTFGGDKITEGELFNADFLSLDNKPFVLYSPGSVHILSAQDLKCVTIRDLNVKNPNGYPSS